MQHFIERKTWLERFKEYVQQDKRIFWPITGPPGRGKSVLLRRFEQHCDEEKHPNVWLDMENPEFAHGLIILTELARSARYFDAEKSGKTLLEKTGESADWLKDKFGGAWEAGKGSGLFL